VVYNLNLLRFLSFRNNSNNKSKFLSAIKEIEFHKKELSNIKLKLEHKNKRLLDYTVQSREQGDEARFNLYASEHVELKKVLNMVNSSELALSQILIRIESVMEVGNVVDKVSSALNSLHNISSDVLRVKPALEDTSQEVNDTLSSMLLDLETISPDLNLSLQPLSDEGNDLLNEIKKYAENKTLETVEQASSTLSPANISEMLSEDNSIELDQFKENADMLSSLPSTFSKKERELTPA